MKNLYCVRNKYDDWKVNVSWISNDLINMVN